MTTSTIRLEMHLEAGELAAALAEEPEILADVLVILQYKLKRQPEIETEIATAVVAHHGVAAGMRLMIQLRSIADEMDRATRDRIAAGAPT